MHSDLSLSTVLEKSNNSFMNVVYVKRLSPKLYIQYKREAYTSLLGEGVRLTFDDELMYSDIMGSLAPKYLYSYPLDQTILEIKFEHENYWVLKLLAELKQSKVSFSKYFQLLDHCNQKSHHGFI